MNCKATVLFCFISTFFCFAAASSSEAETAKDIFRFAERELCRKKAEEPSVFVSSSLLTGGTVIETWKGPFLTLEQDQWFVFIDDHPGANWEHACRYVLIDPGMSGYKVIPGMRPPLMLKEMIRFQGPDPFKGENRQITLQEIHARKNSRSPDNLWAVILSGGAHSYSNYPRYWNDCSEIYKTLKNVYGYLDDHIIAAISDGTDPAADQSTGTSSDPDLDGDGDDDIMYACTFDNLEMIFDDLASSLGSLDTLFIFTTDHGSGQLGVPGQPTSMNLWNGEVIWDYEFAALLEPIACREIILTLEPCFSGGFIDDVINMDSDVPRVISTAANDHEYSWAMPPDYVYDTYVFHWTAAVRWMDAYGTPVDADYNADGEITMDEAYTYAEFMDEDDEHPQYAEWPADYGSTVTLAGSGPASEGSVSLDRDYYNCSDQILITVEDLDLEGEGTVDVEIGSDTETIWETVTLTEINTAHFEGTISAAAGSPTLDGILQVAHNDEIEVRYYDEDHGGSGPQNLTDNAAADCAAPVITNVEATNVSHNSVTITWTTNEAASSKVEYGPDETLGYTAEDEEMTTSHSMELTGLDDCTLYYFQVSSSDSAGNEITDDNSGDFYSFVTWELVILFEENMDANPGWSISGGDWEWGTPLGNDGDPDSGYTGDYVYGYNLEGEYTNYMPEYFLTTPAFDCSASSEVLFSYYRWLGVENSRWDHARLQISNDGSSWTPLWENPSTSLQDTEWKLEEYDISAQAAGHSAVQIRWVMGTTDSSVTYCGWNIDDVLVYVAAPCSFETPTLSPTGPTQTPTKTPTTPPTNTPTRTPTADPNLDILLLSGSCGGSIEYFPPALSNLGHSFTDTGTDADFLGALTGGTDWDLVIVDQYSSYLSPNAKAAIEDYVDNGGYCFINYWDWDDSLAAHFDADYISEYYAPLNIHCWSTSHPLYTTPNALDLLITNSDTCNCDGAYFTAYSGATAVSGYTSSPQTGQHGIIVGNDDRTILFGGIPGLYNDDADDDGKQDMLEFAENAVDFLMSSQPTPSPTVTATQTSTPYPTSSPTPSASSTKTPTAVPSHTPTERPSLTPTTVPTNTPSITPTTSPTLTFTPTVTHTPEPQPVPSFSSTGKILIMTLLGILLGAQAARFKR